MTISDLHKSRSDGTRSRFTPQSQSNQSECSESGIEMPMLETKEVNLELAVSVEVEAEVEVKEGK